MSDGMPMGRTQFFQRLPEKYALSGKSLQTLSGEVIDDASTSLIERVAKAWASPIESLTCEQIRLLTGQRMGLRWLAAPVAAFVVAHPNAVITFYAGDLSIVALRAFALLLEHAPFEARQVADIDFGWMIADWKDVEDASLDTEIVDLLANAKAMCRGHS